MVETRMDRKPLAPQRGFTLTELLVVLVIISILSMVAVPVYLNKSQNARIAAAQHECLELAEAEDSCVVNHGFYVPLQVLNDLPTTSLNPPPPPGQLDAIDQETNLRAVDPNLDALQLTPGFSISGTDTTNPRMELMVRNWQGPFITFHHFVNILISTNNGGTIIGGVNVTNPNRYPPQEHPGNYPVDPWGNYYFFYIPGHLMDISGNSFDNDNRLNGSTSSSNRFTRYAIVSGGPDGKLDPDNTVGDDIIYMFGTVKNETRQ